jgi:hypothetical protein
MHPSCKEFTKMSDNFTDKMLPAAAAAVIIRVSVDAFLEDKYAEDVAKHYKSSDDEEKVRDCCTRIHELPISIKNAVPAKHRESVQKA